MPICRTCSKPLNSPWRVFNNQGRILQGCVDPDHTEHLIKPSESLFWHSKAQIWARQLVRYRKPLVLNSQ